MQDHYQGRRHARRLQYLSHMPDGERNEHLQRTLTAGQLPNLRWTPGGPDVCNLGGEIW